MCEDPPKEVRPRQVDYRIHPNKQEVAKVPAYLCKATVESATLQVFLVATTPKRMQVFDT